MDEPLFDGVTAAIVFLGVAAVLVLRSSISVAANTERRQRLDLAGHLLLGIAISLLLYRWVDAMTALPADSRPNAWRGGALAVACGIGLVAALKAVIGVSITSRFRYFVIACASGTIALFIAAAWDWAVLLLVMLSAGVAWAQWRSTDARDAAQVTDEKEPQREPVLVLLIAAMLLLLLLGTWQHVIDNEIQRRTRSPRYSAWPRATALRDAWERTGWIAKPEDDKSTQRVAKLASHEQAVALGLGALLLVVIASASCRANSERAVSDPTTPEVFDAS